MHFTGKVDQKGKPGKSEINHTTIIISGFREIKKSKYNEIIVATNKETDDKNVDWISLQRYRLF